MTIWTTWGEVFNESLLNLWWGLMQFAPKLIMAIVFFIIGWVLGSLIAKAFMQVFASLKVDKLFQSIGVEDLFRKAGMNFNSGYFVGHLAKWFVVIVFLLPSLNLVFGPNNEVSGFLMLVLAYIPNVAVAAFILIITSIVSEAISKFVASGSKAMNVHTANMLGTISKYAIWIFAVIIALGQLGVAEGYMSTLFAGIIGMLAIAGGLAFGLGGKDAAARFIAKVQEESAHHM